MQADQQQLRLRQGERPQRPPGACIPPSRAKRRPAARPHAIHAHTASSRLRPPSLRAPLPPAAPVWVRLRESRSLRRRQGVRELEEAHAARMQQLTNKAEQLTIWWEQVLRALPPLSSLALTCIGAPRLGALTGPRAARAVRSHPLPSQTRAARVAIAAASRPQPLQPAGCMTLHVLRFFVRRFPWQGCGAGPGEALERRS
jgi:hypothetical protein